MGWSEVKKLEQPAQHDQKKSKAKKTDSNKIPIMHETESISTNNVTGSKL